VNKKITGHLNESCPYFNFRSLTVTLLITFPDPLFETIAGPVSLP